jgi:hypothetical protein
MRARCREQMNKLPDALKKVERTDKHEKLYEVRPSDALNKLLEKIKGEH